MRSSHIIVLVVLALAVAGVVVTKRVTRSRPPADTGAPVEGKVLSGAAFSEALKSGRPTMAEFGLGTCQTCREMAPVLEAAAAELQGEANIASVDLDEYAPLGRYYEVRAMPTQIFFDRAGKEAERHVGKLTVEQISDKLAALGAR